MSVSKRNLDHFPTTFLIPNLHCPSCVSGIEVALGSLHPKPLSISPSIVSRSVTISHKVDLPTGIISKALEDAGFEVYDAFQDSLSDDKGMDYTALEEKFGAVWMRRFERAIEKWSRRGGKSRERIQRGYETHRPV